MLLIKPSIALALGFLALAGVAHAQNTRGYAYVAPGGISSGGETLRTYEVGGGVERLLDRGVGAGAELAGIVPGVGRARDAVGVASLNGFYHFLKDSRLDPFATAGYSLIFRDFTANAFNYGGGLDYWFRDDLGLRLEIRDRIRGFQSAPNAHYWGVRVGLSFR